MPDNSLKTMAEMTSRGRLCARCGLNHDEESLDFASLYPARMRVPVVSLDTHMIVVHLDGSISFEPKKQPIVSIEDVD